MKHVYKLKNEIMPYAWGSHTDLARFMGKKEPSPNPQAEIWMGAHPKAPSKVKEKGKWRGLDELILEHPKEILGEDLFASYGANLPFLFKVLAADQPLSIQAHPDRKQARDGYQAENAKKIPLEAFERNYKDDRHKPECICALTPFWGVCGFRPVAEMLPLLTSVWPEKRRSDLDLFNKDDEIHQVKTFFRFLMTLPTEELAGLLGHIGCASQTLGKDNLIFKWIVQLQRRYPGDAGILSPLFLNLICLQPGEALFLQAGRLHAYFGGLGIEIMANSDNVLRGGLTPKHVDVPELLKVLDFTPAKPRLLKAEQHHDGAWRYPSKAEEFILGHIDVGPQTPYRCEDADLISPQILLCAQGSARITLMADKRSGATLSQGEAALIPHASGGYIIQGEARLYQAAVNQGSLPKKDPL
jgi:mannose-6-phosphate isomerase